MKTLHRPMFRRGGSTGGGITSGLSRQGYEDGNIVDKIRPTKEEYESISGMLPARSRDRLS